MAERHRFQGKDGVDGVCFDAINGSVCALPYLADRHYSDREHPFQGVSVGECRWGLQEVEGQHCGGKALDARHTLGGGVSVVMEYPVAERAAALLGRPPDEDEAARQAFFGGEVTNKKPSTPVPPPPPQMIPQWEQAGMRLIDPAMTVEAGPWQFRKLRVEDTFDPTAALRLLSPLLTSLVAVGEYWSVQTYRSSVDASFWFALVTWGAWYGFGVDEIREALAAEFGDSAG